MKKLLVYLPLALLAACGQAENKDGRTYGGNSLNVDPRQVHGADANPAAPAQPGAQPAPADPAAPAAPAASPADPSAPAADPAAPAAGPTNTAAMVVKTGIRNYASINATMSALTGEPTTTPAVATVFANLSTSMPTDTDVRAFLGSNQVAVYKLAVEYCNALSNDTTNRAAVYGTFNFAATPAVAFTPAATQALADALITKLWGTGLASLPDHATSVQDLDSLINDLVTSKGAAAAATVTPAIVTAACTVTLAAAPVTLY